MTDVSLQILLTRDELETALSEPIAGHDLYLTVVTPGKVRMTFEEWRSRRDVPWAVFEFTSRGQEPGTPNQHFRISWSESPEGGLHITSLAARSTEKSIISAARLMKRRLVKDARSGVIGTAPGKPASSTHYRDVWRTRGAEDAFANGKSWRQSGAVTIFRPPDPPE
jgi:hypothetical protein